MGDKLVYETAISSFVPRHMIKIQGCTTQFSNHFEVNLECRNPCNQSRVTIPFQMHVRFLENCIVRNTLTQTVWGHEERCGGMPIVKGEPFTIELRCKLAGIGISINGSYQFCDYKHCLPYNTINYMTVNNDVEICDVSFIETLPPTCTATTEKVVYESAISSIFPGRKITIQGCVPQFSDRFIVNLKCGNSDIIPLHISVRFLEGCIVRNTLTQTAWGHEERCGGMPIIRGQSFTIQLECKQQEFSISINGCRFSDYKHRLPFDTINYLTVTRDVEVSEVSFSGSCQQIC